jgi:NhaA family Na+:H+ antiporter
VTAPQWTRPRADREHVAGSGARHPWSESERFVPRTVVRPARRLLRLEASSAAVMLACAALALVWANSPWAGGYTAFWSAPVSLAVGPLDAVDGLTLRDWVNDGAMTVFFLVVALEIKRELASGQLRDRRAAALPVLAALGGMAVPALIYLAFNAGTPQARGWGVPMATDIAFAVAVVTLASRRVPSGAKLLLLTLAVADDLGAIAVIAVFYTDGLSPLWLVLAVAAVLAAVALRRLDVRAMLPYLVLGVACWLCLHESGVHTTIAGVAFGFVTPTSSLGAETAAPLDRLVDRLTPWVGFVVLPVFAVANAGLAIGGWSADPVLLGVAIGLLVGKTTGVFGAVWLTCRFTSVTLPPHTTWRHVLGLSLCAGVGFTVALFVSDLSSADPAMVLSAKTGVLVGSLLAGVAGYLVLRTCPEGVRPGVPPAPR